jgi:acetyl esterase/lipase
MRSFIIAGVASVLIYYISGNQISYFSGEQSLIHLVLELLLLRPLQLFVMDSLIATSTDWQSATIQTALSAFRPQSEPPCSEWIFPEGFCTDESLFSVVSVQLPSRDTGRTIAAACVVPLGKDPLPLIIHYHGGGLVIGSIGQEMPITRFLAAEVGAVVCNVDYRLAPEDPYPAGTDDAYDGAMALLSGEGVPTELRARYNSSQSALFGISAGGYIATNTALLLANEGKIAGDRAIHSSTWKVVTQALVVPMAVPFGGTESMVGFFHSPMWSGAMNHWAWSMYLRSDNSSNLALREDWRTNHLKAPASLLQKMPPAYVTLSKQDTLYSEGKMYASLLAGAGVLAGLAEYDTSHIGTIIAGAGDIALPALVEHLRSALVEHLRSALLGYERVSTGSCDS